LKSVLLCKNDSQLFTFCLTTAAVIQFSACEYAWSALLLAFASTQNPSFAAVAITTLTLGAFRKRRDPRVRFPLAACSFALLVASIHPAYYLLRHGVLTPQIRSKGAAPLAHLRLFWIWFLDPDVGFGLRGSSVRPQSE